MTAASVNFDEPAASPIACLPCLILSAALFFLVSHLRFTRALLNGSPSL
jgi:hypothetical protein